MKDLSESFDFGDWNIGICSTGIVTSHFPCTGGVAKSSVRLDRFGALQCMFCNSFIPEDIQVARKFIEEAFFYREFNKEYEKKIIHYFNAINGE